MKVVLRRLRKRFDVDDVLVELDLDLHAGQRVAVIGLNGAGKTTLLRCLAGLVAPSAGTIRWDGRDDLRDEPALHRQMMFLPDAPLLLEDESVIENLVVFLRGYGREETVSDDSVVEVLRELDLLPHCTTKVVFLSRGQRYKVALAALLLIQPELWLLDEPFASGMDPQGMLVLKRRGERATGHGACLVYTTQILEIAERYCDLLLVLDRGRLAHRFSREELRALPAEGPGSLGERLSELRELR